MSTRARTRRRPALQGAWMVGVFSTACNAVDPAATITSRCPDAQEFAHVAPWLEAGCGTLDCHGQLPRPMRVYGERGLRLEPGDVAGGRGTTPEERDATVRSVCSLEPERMNEVLTGHAAADELLAVGKARGDIAHKGGRVVQAGDDADRCFTSWLEGSADVAACQRASP